MRQYLKLEIYIPETHLQQLQKALQSVDAGHIGNYDSCMSYSRVTGCWRPLEGTTPYIGENGRISEEPELKVEVTIRKDQLSTVMQAVLAIHPYEEPVINVIELYATAADYNFPTGRRVKCRDCDKAKQQRNSLP